MCKHPYISQPSELIAKILYSQTRLIRPTNIHDEFEEVTN